ncbi:MAG TPA: hypothetical protein VJ849_06365, partial [Actinomycetes bacterium]|nr:hypothetical protein [Actinomycetes bacterium]
KRQAAMQRRTATVLRPLGDGWARVPVRPLLCLHSRWPVRSRPADGLRVAAPAQLPDIVRDGPTTQPTDLEQATSRLLDVLRPAA